jgi:hypothetical protein
VKKNGKDGDEEGDDVTFNFGGVLTDDVSVKNPRKLSI